MFRSASTLADTRRNGGSWEVIIKGYSPIRLIGEKIFEKFYEQNYADLYSLKEKPSISPAILAFGMVFQIVGKLSDRQVAEPRLFLLEKGQTYSAHPLRKDPSYILFGNSWRFGCC